VQQHAESHVAEWRNSELGLVATLLRHKKSRYYGALSVIGFAIAWQIASLYAPPYAIPGWQVIFNALIKLRIDYILMTLARLLASLVASFVLGMIVAFLMFQIRIVEQVFMPLVRILMSVPAVCWVVFSILWFKGVEFRIFFAMIMVCAPIFIIDFLDGMKAVPHDLRQMVASFRPHWATVFIKLTMPAILPNVFTSWKINLSQAVRVILTVELVGATSGIGYGLVLAQELFSVATVFAWTVVLVIMLFALQGIFDVLEARLLRWREASV
jgi:ABC-type nitrate/sulfonate/bicarbonate transport system permease component